MKKFRIISAALVVIMLMLVSIAYCEEDLSKVFFEFYDLDTLERLDSLDSVLMNFKEAVGYIPRCKISESARTLKIYLPNTSIWGIYYLVVDRPFVPHWDEETMQKIFDLNHAPEPDPEDIDTELNAIPLIVLFDENHWPTDGRLEYDDDGNVYWRSKMIDKIKNVEYEFRAKVVDRREHNGDVPLEDYPQAWYDCYYYYLYDDQ